MTTRTLTLSALISASLLLGACGVDTTGLTGTSAKAPKGPASAAVTLTEYGDLQCPACKAAHEILTKPILAQYSGKIRFEYKHFPLRSIHVYAYEAAQASECAADQGKFWEFVDLDYAKQDALSSNALRDWAAELRLDTALFDRCVKSGIKGDTVLAEYAQGEKLGVNSTPTYFVNGVRVESNTIEAMKAAIDAALKQVNSVPL